MTTVRKFGLKVPDRVSNQTESDATVALIDFNGEKFVQLDSVGSKDRKFVGKRSQSMRLSKDAFDQLVRLGNKHFGQS
ncbi:hypothetical protein [Sphingomonas sp.]|uniref:hypothetical protein n=1 Tax=Sphingomonas sp. TaxID=28214 RepID=UPI00286D7E7A|nr:hypothetical protein [Sphingomonas sp.]